MDQLAVPLQNRELLHGVQSLCLGYLDKDGVFIADLQVNVRMPQIRRALWVVYSEAKSPRPIPVF